MAAITTGIAGGGRMGQALVAAIDAADDLTLAGQWRRGADLTEIVANCDVLVDFTLPEATAAVIGAVIARRVPLVCGVSGFGAAEEALLNSAAAVVPVVHDRNMSRGIAVLERLARDAAVSLGSDFDVEIRETHHVHKKDAPSGTALKLGEAIAAARGMDPAMIHYESERRGEVLGEHTVILRSATEEVTLGHSVTTRQVFAEGALHAARWIAGQPPGRYSMQDVLFGR